jgi:hypothetical protein
MKTSRGGKGTVSLSEDSEETSSEVLAGVIASPEREVPREVYGSAGG